LPAKSLYARDEIEVKDRRAVRRYKAHIPCSVNCAATGATLLSRTPRSSACKPSHLLFLSTLPMAPMIHQSRDEGVTKIGSPVGYVRLSGVLLRHQQADPEDHLFVFKIEAASDLDQRLYDEYVDHWNSKPDDLATIFSKTTSN